MPVAPVDWTGAVTLGERLTFLVKTSQVESKEFKTMVAIFGQEKVRSLLREYRDKTRANSAESSSEVWGDLPGEQGHRRVGRADF